MSKMVETGEATAYLPIEGQENCKITVIGTESIRKSFDEACIKQAINSAQAPGVSKVVLNPDGHSGYGAPVGCVLASPTHIYPGPVGVDIKCSMSLLQLTLPALELHSKEVRRAVINELQQRLPTGAGKGQRSVKKSRRVDFELGQRLVIEGASPWGCQQLGVPVHWAEACEDAQHFGHDNLASSLSERFDYHCKNQGKDFLLGKLQQLGSYGGGNHFGEANSVHIEPEEIETAKHFGLLDQKIAFLSHCGSRGFGYFLAHNQFKKLQAEFAAAGRALPGNDKNMVYTELGTESANQYLDDMALGANFATLNHLLINALVLESFQAIFPGVKGDLVYFISHNIARKEELDGQQQWIHRKGATRAFPAGHAALKNSRYADTGHPILLPGNPAAGSAVMVANSGAELSCFSVNHGAGRAMSRARATKELNQESIEEQLAAHDIISNCRVYPKDEAPQAYKNFDEVLRSVEKANLARRVANLKARFVIKDGDTSNGGAA
jgi:tRNA-splicing ligase RtcB